MTYITGSITDANPGPALYALMEPALTTAGFTLVDTVVISTRTHKIWKSPAASNVQNLDWYLDIGYTTTGAGTITLITFEMFDPVTDLAYRGPYTASSSTIDAATGSRYGATGYALETNWLPNAGTVGIQTALTTTTFGYWISVTADRVILLCSGAPSTVMYAGLYTPDPLYAAKAGAELFPLFTGQVGRVSNGSFAALTRIAPWTAFSAGGETWSSTVGSVVTTTWYPQLPTDSVASYPYSAAPIALQSGHQLFHSGRWGWLKDVYTVSAVVGSVVRGDTCTIGGAQHVLTTPTASAGLGVSMCFKAA